MLIRTAVRCFCYPHTPIIMVINNGGHLNARCTRCTSYIMCHMPGLYSTVHRNQMEVTGDNLHYWCGIVQRSSCTRRADRAFLGSFRM